MKIKAAKEEYLKIAEHLTSDQKDRLLCRMRGKLTRRMEDKKLLTNEALAIQLEIEDADLAEWREKMTEIKAKEKAKKKH
jgi:predicted secreted protein